MFFIFVGCNKKDDENNKPQGGSEHSQPINPQQPVSIVTYSVYFDYGLPKDYEYLLNNYSALDKSCGTYTDLARVSDDLLPYFDGWYDGETLVDSKITSDSSKEFRLKGKWKETELENYYCSFGVEFNIVDSKAYVSNYKGTANKIIIPKYYKKGQETFEVKGFADSCLKNSNWHLQRQRF